MTVRQEPKEETRRDPRQSVRETPDRGPLPRKVAPPKSDIRSRERVLKLENQRKAKARRKAEAEAKAKREAAEKQAEAIRQSRILASRIRAADLRRSPTQGRNFNPPEIQAALDFADSKVGQKLSEFRAAPGAFAGFDLAAALASGKVGRSELKDGGFSAKDIDTAADRAGDQQRQAATLAKLEPFKDGENFDVGEAIVQGKITRSELTKAGFDGKEIDAAVKNRKALSREVVASNELKRLGILRGGSIDLVKLVESRAENLARDLGVSQKDILIGRTALKNRNEASKRVARQERQESQERQTRVSQLEEDRDTALASQNQRANEAINSLANDGFANVVDGKVMVDIPAAVEAGKSDILVRAGFKVKQISTAVRESKTLEATTIGKLADTINLEKDIEQKRTDATKALQDAGAIEDGGVFISKAIESGVSRSTLIDFGFTNKQITSALEETRKIRANFARQEKFAILGDVREQIKALKEDREGRKMTKPLDDALIKAKRDERIARRSDSTGFATQVNPDTQALIRKRQVIEDIREAVRKGQVKNIDAEKLLKKIPDKPTEEDRKKARDVMRTVARFTPFVSPIDTAYGIIEGDSKKMIALNVGLDALMFTGWIGAASSTARTGVKGSRVALAVAEMEMANPLTALVDLPGTARTLIGPARTLLGPRRIPIAVAEIRTSTVRVPTTPSGGSATTVKVPGSVTSQAIPSDVKLASNDAVLDAIQGNKATVNFGDEAGKVEITPAKAQKVIGAAAMTASPDIRPFINGVEIQGREGGLFVANSLHTRFSASSAFGESGGAFTADAAQVERLKQLGVGKKQANAPMNGGLIIRDPEALKVLKGATDPDGTPKLFNNQAELEAVIPDGFQLPRVSQVIRTTDGSGKTIWLGIVGEPFSPLEIAKLKFYGPAETIKSIFRPAGKFKGGTAGEVIPDEVGKLIVQAEKLEDQIRIARIAGKADDITDLTKRLRETRRAADTQLARVRSAGVTNLFRRVGRVGIATTEQARIRADKTLRLLGSDLRIGRGPSSRPITDRKLKQSRLSSKAKPRAPLPGQRSERERDKKVGRTLPIRPSLAPGRTEKTIQRPKDDKDIKVLRVKPSSLKPVLSVPTQPVIPSSRVRTQRPTIPKTPRAPIETKTNREPRRKGRRPSGTGPSRRVRAPKRFTIPDKDGKTRQLPPGVFPRILTWQQGVNQITLNIDTGRKSFTSDPKDRKLKPLETFRVAKFDNTRPQSRKFDMGVVSIRVSPIGLKFIRRRL